MNWLIGNWEYIAIAAYVAINVLNAVSTHWSTKTGLVRWCLFLVEILSIISSKNAVNGRYGKLKTPFRSVKFLLPFIFIVGCSTHFDKGKAALYGVKVFAEVSSATALDYFQIKCKAIAEKCQQSPCVELEICQRQRQEVKKVFEHTLISVKDMCDIMPLLEEMVK